MALVTETAAGYCKRKSKATFKAGLSALLLTAAVDATCQQAPSFSNGSVVIVVPGLLDCGPRARVSAVGKVKSEDGAEWIVPAQTNFASAPKATDLYNDCTDVRRGGLSAVDLAKVPTVDAGGEEQFLVYLFADNYFELYVNGRLLAVDPVPFTPFNSNVLRFKARRPITLAIMMVDWEENLGLGTERGRGFEHFPGDGGLVLHLQDESGATIAISDSSWRAQTFYTAPIKDRQCLRLIGNVRDSTHCDVKGVQDGNGLSAAHWPVPHDWMAPAFDDSDWPMATTFTNETVGVSNKRAYTNFSDLFDAPEADAQFIWSSNLILDNLVLLRKQIE